MKHKYQPKLCIYKINAIVSILAENGIKIYPHFDKCKNQWDIWGEMVGRKKIIIEAVSFRDTLTNYDTSQNSIEVFFFFFLKKKDNTNEVVELLKSIKELYQKIKVK